MRVLYLMNHVDQGGAALALYDLLVQLKKSTDIEMIVLTGKKNALNRMLSDIGIENYSLSYKNFMSSYMQPEYLFKILLKIRYKLGCRKALKEIDSIIDFKKIDLIHSNLNRIDFGVIIAQKYNIPHLWHIRELDDVSFKLMSIKNDPYKYMCSYESHYVAISECVKKHWINKGLDKRKMHLVYDGIRAELYPERLENYNEKDEIHMIFLGGYCESKGQDELIEALNILERELIEKIRVDFYGNGKESYVKFLKEKLIKYGLLDRVNLYNYDSDIWKKIKNYEVGFNCSRSEGFGRVTVEYMMSGLCSIVSDGGANSELIKDNETGLIYKKGSIDSLAEKIRFVVLNQNVAFECGKNARKYALECFSMEKHAKKIINLYSELALKK